MDTDLLKHGEAALDYIRNARIENRKNAGHFLPIVTTTKGMSGYFAVIMYWNTDLGGFWEPLDTGINRYPTNEGAINEAKEIAENLKLQYQESGK